MSSVSSSSSSSAKPLKIGMVGFGTFAQFLSQTMIKQGHTIRATSRTDYSHLCHPLGISFFQDVGEFLEADNDVVMLCTSILSLSEVLKSMPLHCLKRPVLFVDVLSVKEHPREVLLQVLPESSDVLCTHPMFGPESGKNGWKDLAFMYEKVRIKDEIICSSFIQIFESEASTGAEIRGCKMLEMSCEEHDRMAARSQFLTHTIGRTLSEMQIEPTPIDTKGFQTLLQLLKKLELALEKVKQKLLERANEEEE
ncbi:hypothetical protein L1049_012137 [Liquidambar formosana]|uniref:Prephenate/arogenate dehydrogenase domain-containing protein n=1 Tax=Liquidambar formosana TaxID=63359 RepID=A0AAP0WYL0_LIQFO